MPVFREPSLFIKQHLRRSHLAGARQRDTAAAADGRPVSSQSHSGHSLWASVGVMTVDSSRAYVSSGGSLDVSLRGLLKVSRPLVAGECSVCECQRQAQVCSAVI